MMMPKNTLSREYGTQLIFLPPFQDIRPTNVEYTFTINDNAVHSHWLAPACFCRFCCESAALTNQSSAWIFFFLRSFLAAGWSVVHHSMINPSSALSSIKTTKSCTEKGCQSKSNTRRLGIFRQTTSALRSLLSEDKTTKHHC